MTLLYHHVRCLHLPDIVPSGSKCIKSIVKIIGSCTQASILTGRRRLMDSGFSVLMLDGSLCDCFISLVFSLQLKIPGSEDRFLRQNRIIKESSVFEEPCKVLRNSYVF